MRHYKVAMYEDMASVEVRENGEIFVEVCHFDQTIKFGHGEYSHRPSDMRQYFGGKVVVRKGTAYRLALANKYLRSIHPSFRLHVDYGYRTLEIQRQRYQEKYDGLDPSFPFEKRRELANMLTAAPEVAGHPTGGAVDITVFDEKNGIFLDMGSLISDFTIGKHSTFASGLSRLQERNRLLLDHVMVSQGFCHYYGEWWHFCYGEREWAFFYCQPFAIYSQKLLHEVTFE